jgi:hypothetical protein
MIRTLIVEDSAHNEKQIKVGWKHDESNIKVDFVTHDINQDAEGIVDDLNSAGYNYKLIGEQVE